MAFAKDDLATLGNRLLRMKYKMSVQEELEDTLVYSSLCFYAFILFYENGYSRGYRVKPRNPGGTCQCAPDSQDVGIM